MILGVSIFLGALEITSLPLRVGSNFQAIVCHDWFLLSPTSPSLLWDTPITSVQWLATGEF